MMKKLFAIMLLSLVLFTGMDTITEVITQLSLPAVDNR